MLPSPQSSSSSPPSSPYDMVKGKTKATHSDRIRYALAKFAADGQMSLTFTDLWTQIQDDSAAEGTSNSAPGTSKGVRTALSREALARIIKFNSEDKNCFDITSAGAQRLPRRFPPAAEDTSIDPSRPYVGCAVSMQPAAVNSIRTVYASLVSLQKLFQVEPEPSHMSIANMIQALSDLSLKLQPVIEDVVTQHGLLRAEHEKIDNHLTLGLEGFFASRTKEMPIDSPNLERLQKMMEEAHEHALRSQRLADHLTLYSPERLELHHELNVLQGRVDDLQAQLETQYSQGVSEYTV